MRRVPTEEEIRARAAQLGVLTPDGTVPPAQRGRVARAIVDEQKAAAAPAAPAGPVETLLSRSVIQVADGHLIVEVRHVPAPPAAADA